MNSFQETIQQDTERLNQSALLARELAELVDEWSVTQDGPRAQEIASEMIRKAREVLRASRPLVRVAKTA